MNQPNRDYRKNVAAPYYNGPSTICPACTVSNWYIGRGDFVECAACHYVLVKAYREEERFSEALV